jgi:tight adherence protein B
MSVEAGFLATGSLIVLLFGLKLMFGGVSLAGSDSVHKIGKGFNIVAPLRIFISGSGLSVPPTLVLLCLVLLSLLVVMLMLEVFADSLIIPVFAGAIFLTASFGIIKDIALWRARRFETKLIDAIDAMVQLMRSGSNVSQALRESADIVDPGIKREFSEIVRRLELGQSIEDSLARLNHVFDSEGVRLFSMALRAKWDSGGDLSSVLTSVNRTLRERVKIRLQLTGQLSGVRFAAFALAAAPYALYLFFMLVQPVWVSTIHAHPSGPNLLYAGLSCQILGMLWLNFILNNER